MSDNQDIFDFFKKGPSETPDKSYFEQLARQIVSENAPVSPQKTTIVPLYRKPILWLTTAAAAILIFFLLRPENSPLVQSEPVDFNDLSRQEILSYIHSNLEDFDEDLLIEFISEDRLAFNEVEVSKPEPFVKRRNATNLSNSMESLSKEEILNYLDEENMDIDELEDDLYY